MYKIILAVAAFVICNGTAQARDTAGKKNVTYLDAVRFENREIAKDGREVCLNMDIILDSAKIRTQHTVSLTPVLVSADGKQEKAFETVIVDGKTRHKVDRTGICICVGSPILSMDAGRESDGKRMRTGMRRLWRRDI